MRRHGWLRRGEHPSGARRSRCVGWHSCVARFAVDLSSPRWAPPYSSRQRHLSQRGRTSASCRGENSFGFFYMYL